MLPSISDSALAASSSVEKLTKPNPRERPVSLSRTTATSSTVPNGLKASRSACSSAAQGRPPTNSFLVICLLVLCCGFGGCSDGVRRSRLKSTPTWSIGAKGTKKGRSVGFRAAVLSGRQDSNLRPPEPHSGALPGCATPRDSDAALFEGTVGRKPIQVTPGPFFRQAGDGAKACPPHRSFRTY